MSFSADLPDDIDALKALLVTAEAQITAQNETLAERDGIIEIALCASRRCWPVLSVRFTAQSLRRAIRINTTLRWQDIETAMAVVHAEDGAVDPPNITALVEVIRWTGAQPTRWQTRGKI